MATTAETEQKINDLLDAGVPLWDDRITSLQKELIASNCEREWVYYDDEGEGLRGMHRNMEEAFEAFADQCRKHLDLIDPDHEWDSFEIGVYCKLTGESDFRDVQR